MWFYDKLMRLYQGFVWLYRLPNRFYRDVRWVYRQMVTLRDQEELLMGLDVMADKLARGFYVNTFLAMTVLIFLLVESRFESLATYTAKYKNYAWFCLMELTCASAVPAAQWIVLRLLANHLVDLEEKRLKWILAPDMHLRSSLD